jgi:probable rRNA maturation factor
MGKLVIESLDKKVKTRKIAKTVYQVLGQKAKIKAELVFQDKDEIHDLNRITHGVDSVTDVLSYPTLDGIRGVVLTKKDCATELDGKYIFLGSIVMCLDKIKQQAQEIGHSEEEERNYLIIHGLLHLFGYDHISASDKKQMREKEKAVIELLNFKKNQKAQKREKKLQENKEKGQAKNK